MSSSRFCRKFRSIDGVHLRNDRGHDREAGNPDLPGGRHAGRIEAGAQPRERHRPIEGAADILLPAPEELHRHARPPWRSAPLAARNPGSPRAGRSRRRASCGEPRPCCATSRRHPPRSRARSRRPASAPRPRPGRGRHARCNSAAPWWHGRETESGTRRRCAAPRRRARRRHRRRGGRCRRAATGPRAAPLRWCALETCSLPPVSQITGSASTACCACHQLSATTATASASRTIRRTPFMPASLVSSTDRKLPLKTGHCRIAA